MAILFELAKSFLWLRVQGTISYRESASPCPNAQSLNPTPIQCVVLASASAFGFRVPGYRPMHKGLGMWGFDLGLSVSLLVSEYGCLFFWAASGFG